MLANDVVVPLPDLGSNGLTNRAQNTEVLHLTSNVLVASALQQTQSGGGNVELGNLVLVDNVPVAGEVGVGGGALEDDCGDTKEERGVDDVGVAGNPADIATAKEAVSIVNVKDVLSGHGTAEEIAGRGVHDTLGLAGRARSVEEEERVLGVHGLGGNVVGPLVDLVVPPDIAALLHGDVGTGAAEDENVADGGALLESLVDDFLGANELAAALALVRGDDDAGIGVQDTVAQGVGGEAGKDDGVDGANSDTGENGDNGLGNHGKVNGDGVTLLDAHLLEGPGDLADIAEELRVGDVAAIFGLVGLVDDGDAVGVLEGVTIDAVVGSIELTLDEPLVVAGEERAAVDGLEVAGPCEELTSLSTPEGGGICDGLFVELLVLFSV